MGTIISGGVVALAASLLIVLLDIKRQKGKRVVTGGSKGIAVFNCLALTVMGVIAGFIVASYLAPANLPVEERVVVGELLPFALTMGNENREIYTISIGTDSSSPQKFLVLYRDMGGAEKMARCCDGETIVRVKEAENGHSIKMYHRPSYFGTWSARFGETWYEVRIPPRTPDGVAVRWEGSEPISAELLH